MTLDEVRAQYRVTEVRIVISTVCAVFVDGDDGKPWLFAFIDDSLHSGIAFDFDREREEAFADFKRMMLETLRYN